MGLESRPGGWADAQPVEAERVAVGNPVGGFERQEFGEGELLAAIEHVALVLGDDEGKAGDLGGEMTKLDAAEVGERDVGGAVCLAAAAVDLRLDGTHFLVGDDKEVAG